MGPALWYNSPNTSCWAVRTASEHPPSSNSRQHGARLWEGLAGEPGCSARTRHCRDKAQHEHRLKVDRQTKLLWDHAPHLEQRQRFSDKYDARLPCRVRSFSADPQRSEHQCWQLMVPTSISLCLSTWCNPAPLTRFKFFNHLVSPKHLRNYAARYSSVLCVRPLPNKNKKLTRWYQNQ